MRTATIILSFMLALTACDPRPYKCPELYFADIIPAGKTAVGAEVPKIIWTFWDKGEAKMPAFHKFNVNNLRLKLEPQGYKVVVVNLVEGDKDNAYTILGGKDKLPPYIESLQERAVYRNFENMNTAVIQSDIIRLALLEKFGGIWTDATNVLVKDIDSLVTKEFIQSPQTIAGYTMERYASKGSQRVNGKPVDGFENWLIVAKKNSPLIKAWQRAFTEYWRTKIPNQSTDQHRMFYCQEFDFGGMGASEYLNQHAVLKYVLSQRADFSQEIFPLDFNPWWLHDKAGDLLAAVIAPDHQQLAQQAINDGVVLLKFASSHLPGIHGAFKNVKDYCTKGNFFADLYRLTMSPKSWCDTL